VSITQITLVRALRNAPVQAITLFEHLIKRPLFGCQMCGHCILQDTAFICPMACPKGLRDGPCGGTDINGMCETDPSLPCVWLRIYERAEKLGRVDRLMKLQDDLDWRRQGDSTWLPLLKQPFVRAADKTPARGQD
jgi:hypothetical protein